MRIGTLSSCALALTLLGAPAWADVESQLPPRAVVRGTLLPEGEVDVFQFSTSAGTELSLVLGAKGKATLDLEPTLTAPGAVPVDLADAVKFIDTDKKLVVSRLTLPVTGYYTLRVAATGSGEYGMSFKLRVPKLPKSVETLAPDESTTLGFWAPIDSTVTLKANASKSSGATPRFGLIGRGDVVATDEILKDVQKDNSHLLQATLLHGGPLEVELANEGDGAGDIKVSITVKAPKLKPAKLDVRADSLGAPQGGETFRGRLIRGADGGSLDVDDEDSPLMGASVIVPAGAFEGTHLVSLSSAPVDDVAEPTRQAAGPSVELRTASGGFLESAQVSLPFVAADLPLLVEADDVEVQQTQGKSSTTLAVEELDELEGLVTVLASDGARFLPVAPRGSPRMDGRSYWFFGQDVEHLSDPKTGVSLYRVVAQVHGEVSFAGDAEGTYSYSGSEFEAFFGHSDFDAVGTVMSGEQPLEEGGLGGTWAYAADGQRLELDSGGDGDAYYVAHDGSLLLPAVSPEDSTRTSLELFLERSTEPPTFASLAGTYAVFDFRFEAYQTGGPLGMAGANSAGSITLEDDGTVTVSLTERQSFFEGGTAFERETGKGSLVGSYIVDVDGSLVITLPEDDVLEGDYTERFFPNLRGDLIVGAVPLEAQPDDEGLFSMAVLVRQAQGLSPASLSGDYVLVSQELEYETAVVANATVPDFVSLTLQTVLAFDGSTALNPTSFLDREIRRDDSSADGVFVETLTDPGDFPTSFKLSSDGTLKIADVIGAFDPTATFAFSVLAPQVKEDRTGAFVILKLPPAQQR